MASVSVAVIALVLAAAAAQGLLVHSAPLSRQGHGRGHGRHPPGTPPQGQTPTQARVAVIEEAVPQSLLGPDQVGGQPVQALPREEFRDAPRRPPLSAPTREVRRILFGRDQDDFGDLVVRDLRNEDGVALASASGLLDYEDGDDAAEQGVQSAIVTAPRRSRCPPGERYYERRCRIMWR